MLLWTGVGCGRGAILATTRTNVICKVQIFGIKGRQTLEVLGIALGADGSWAWERGRHISLLRMLLQRWQCLVVGWGTLESRERLLGGISFGRHHCSGCLGHG